CARHGEWFVLGGGSTLFVGDEPFEGTVIRVLTTGIELIPSPHPGRMRVRVQAGHNWDDLVAYTVEQGLAGIEAMSGIPGTVGAAPVQNVGAYGQEIQDTLVEVELIDESTGEVSTVPASELGLGFRTSVLKHHYDSVPLRHAVILSVTLDLAEVERIDEWTGGGSTVPASALGLGFRTSVRKHPYDSVPLRHAVIPSVTLDLAEVGPAGRMVRGEQLRRALGLTGDEAVPLAWVRSEILRIRAAKGMLLDDADVDTNSAGSFFQNLIVSEAVANQLPPECPRWPVAPDLDTVTVIPLEAYDGQVPAAPAVRSEVKVSAGWLI